MNFAMQKHEGQVRKYTNEPYVKHLAEVAGMVAAIGRWGIAPSSRWDFDLDQAMSMSWMHDVMEDQGIELEELISKFGITIAEGVQWLTDQEVGNRRQRVIASAKRLYNAPAVVQLVKSCDVWSNTSSIAVHDPKFGVTYCEEKLIVVQELTKLDYNWHARVFAHVSLMKLNCEMSLREMKT